MEWAASQEDLSPALLKGLCFVESNHKPNVIHRDDHSSGQYHGADSIGLCQIKMATAKQVGYIGAPLGLLNPYTNALYAAKTLNRHLKRYNNIEYAIASYNRGSLKLKRGKPVNNSYVVKVSKATLKFL
jgi:soluble lytic murein transglycosylase-like protein